MRLWTLVVIAISLAVARPADAQSITLAPCWRPAIGVGLGPMANADRNGNGSEYEFRGKGAARQLNASIEVPAGGRWAARIEAGTVSWAFEDHDFQGKLLLRDEVRLKRLTAAAMKSFGDPCDFPLRFFAGGGLGAYRYEYAQGGSVTRPGAHAFAGIDVLLGQHAAISVVASTYFVDGPGRDPVFSVLFMPGGLSVGMKFAF